MDFDLSHAQKEWADLPPAAVVQRALGAFGSTLAMSSHFRRESAVMIHLVTVECGLSDIPVVYIEENDEETRHFAYELKRHFALTLVTGTLRKNDGKLATLQRTLKSINARAVMHGARADQSEIRAAKKVVELGEDGYYRIYPLLQRTQQEIEAYIAEHGLPINAHFDPLNKREDCELMCAPISNP